MARKDPTRGRPESNHPLTHMFSQAVKSLHRIAVGIEKANSSTKKTEIGLHVAAVAGRQSTEAEPMNIDRGSLNLLDTEKVLLSIAAKDAAGTTDGFPADQYTWAVDAPGVIELKTEDTDADGNVVQLDPYTRMARTPTAGTAIVTVTGPNGTSETLTLVVALSGPGEIGLSAGTPVPE